MYRLYKITKNEEGTDHSSLDEYEDVNIAEGNFKFIGKSNHITY